MIKRMREEQDFVGNLWREEASSDETSFVTRKIGKVGLTVDVQRVRALVFEILWEAL